MARSRDELEGMAEYVASTVLEYSNQDPAEVLDEMVRIMEESEELSYSDAMRLRDYAWDLVN